MNPRHDIVKIRLVSSGPTVKVNLSLYLPADTYIMEFAQMLANAAAYRTDQQIRHRGDYHPWTNFCLYYMGASLDHNKTLADYGMKRSSRRYVIHGDLKRTGATDPETNNSEEF